MYRLPVDWHVILAVWGVETDYGRVTGSHFLPHALATLTCRGGRRADFWRGELIAALQLVDRGDLPLDDLYGSWAGAFGQTQFIPSTYRRLAVDFDGDGRRDIWSDDPTDALASTAAYLARFGWETGRPWGVEVRLPRARSRPGVARPASRRTASLEGMRVLCLDDDPEVVQAMTALLSRWGCQARGAADERDRQEAADLSDLMTPVIKGFLTDKGFETTVLAQQTLGGSGFTREWGLEQFVRDARITMIYEGTNGIQALDLVGRKLGQNGGKAVMAFFEMVKAFIRDNGEDARLREPFLDPLKAASKDLQSAATYFVQHGMRTPENALAGSYDFMHLFGHVCLGLMWARMAKAAHAALDAGTSDPGFYEAKLATGRYYMARHLPAAGMHLARIESGAETVMALEPTAF